MTYSGLGVLSGCTMKPMRDWIFLSFLKMGSEDMNTTWLPRFTSSSARERSGFTWPVAGFVRIK